MTAGTEVVDSIFPAFITGLDAFLESVLTLNEVQGLFLKYTP